MFPNLGLEPTPDLFIQHMVEIFREVKRVLRDDGCVWLNLGDSFSAAGWESSRRNVVGQGSFDPADRKSGKVPGLAAGNLMLMPHRVAIALQDDGWIVRNDVVWYKRNPMPESQAGWRFERERTKIKPGDGRQMGDPGQTGKRSYLPQTDGGYKVNVELAEWEYGEDYELRKGSWRHTRAHEYIFMLTKKMQYFANQEAVREQTKPDPRDKKWGMTERTSKHDHSDDDGKGMSQLAKGYIQMSNPAGRNPRSVLDVPTAPYSGAHYATFPPNLIAPLIRATCPRWACPVCGQGWSPVVEKGELTKGESARYDEWNYGKLDGFSEGEQIQAGKASNMRYTGFIPGHFKPTSIKGYRPTCEHPHTIEEAVPGIVCDPFLGSGTVGQVARELQRRWIGLDISFEYLDLQAKVRTKSGSPSNELDGLPLFDKELV